MMMLNGYDDHDDDNADDDDDDDDDSRDMDRLGWEGDVLNDDDQ